MKKFSLKELESFLPVMNLQEQNAIVGGGLGTPSSPYTMNEYSTMVSRGTWRGGYVEGYGQYISLTNTNLVGSSYNGKLFGGNGTSSNPYSFYQFLNWYGIWPGGYVYGYGYIIPDVVIYGSKSSAYSYIYNNSSSYSYSYSSKSSSSAGTVSPSGSSILPSTTYHYYSDGKPKSIQTKMTFCDLTSSVVNYYDRHSADEEYKTIAGRVPGGEILMSLILWGADQQYESLLLSTDVELLSRFVNDAAHCNYSCDKQLILVKEIGTFSVDYYLKDAAGNQISHYKSELKLKPYQVR